MVRLLTKNNANKSTFIQIKLSNNPDDEVERKPIFDTTIRVLRPHSTPATLHWLEQNYELSEGVCIPRSTLYTHYVDFCARNYTQPVNAASFGKVSLFALVF